MLILRFIFMFFLSRVDRVKDAVSTWKKLNLTWEIIYLFTPNWWGVSPLQDENEQKTSKRPTNVCEHCIVKTWCRAALASAIGGGAACRRPSPGGTKTAHFWHWPFSGSLRRLLPLGKGSYGEVFACHHRHQGKHFALKRMSKGLIVAETYVSCEWDVSTGVIRIFAGFARRDRASAGNVWPHQSFGFAAIAPWRFWSLLHFMWNCWDVLLVLIKWTNSN